MNRLRGKARPVAAAGTTPGSATSGSYSSFAPPAPALPPNDVSRDEVLASALAALPEELSAATALPDAAAEATHAAVPTQPARTSLIPARLPPKRRTTIEPAPLLADTVAPPLNDITGTVTPIVLPAAVRPRASSWVPPRDRSDSTGSAPAPALLSRSARSSFSAASGQSVAAIAAAAAAFAARARLLEEAQTTVADDEEYHVSPLPAAGSSPHGAVPQESNSSATAAAAPAPAAGARTIPSLVRRVSARGIAAAQTHASETPPRGSLTAAATDEVARLREAARVLEAEVSAHMAREADMAKQLKRLEGEKRESDSECARLRSRLALGAHGSSGALAAEREAWEQRANEQEAMWKQRGEAAEARHASRVRDLESRLADATSHGRDMADTVAQLQRSYKQVEAAAESSSRSQQEAIAALHAQYKPQLEAAGAALLNARDTVNALETALTESRRETAVAVEQRRRVELNAVAINARVTELQSALETATRNASAVTEERDTAIRHADALRDEVDDLKRALTALPSPSAAALPDRLDEVHQLETRNALLESAVAHERDRFATVSQLVVELQSQLEAVTASVAARAAEQASFVAALTRKHELELAAVARDVNALSLQVGAAVAGTAQIESAALDSFSTSAGVWSQTLDRVCARVAQCEDECARARDRVAEGEQEVQNMQAQMQACTHVCIVAHTLSRVCTRALEGRPHVRDCILGDVHAPASTWTVDEDALTAVCEEVHTLSTRARALETRLYSAVAQVSGLTSHLNSSEADRKRLALQLCERDDDIGALTRSVEQLHAHVHDLSAELSAAAQRADDAVSRATAAEQQAAEQTRVNVALKARVLKLLAVKGGLPLAAPTSSLDTSASSIAILDVDTSDIHEDEAEQAQQPQDVDTVVLLHGDADDRDTSSLEPPSAAPVQPPLDDGSRMLTVTDLVQSQVHASDRSIAQRLQRLQSTSFPPPPPAPASRAASVETTASSVRDRSALSRHVSLSRWYTNPDELVETVAVPPHLRSSSTGGAVRIRVHSPPPSLAPRRTSLDHPPEQTAPPVAAPGTATPQRAAVPPHRRKRDASDAHVS